MTTTLPKVPETCAIAFKEWEGICAALAEGRQALILRKGGIAEGPGGFRPEHEAFWLYPTRLHEGQQGLAVEPPTPVGPPPGEPEMVPLRSLAVVASIDYLERPESLEALAPYHLWTEETVRKRFFYRRPGLWVLGVRVYNRPTPWPVAVTPEQRGCKTWVPLDNPPPTAGLVPALEDVAFHRQIEAIRDALGRTP
ncbi:MAG: DUF1802 family protein [Isosphaeraceae bacterium]|nr:DUF1802 family protein [Isosphaeraceae bacterium]